MITEIREPIQIKGKKTLLSSIQKFIFQIITFGKLPSVTFKDSFIVCKHGIEPNVIVRSLTKLDFGDRTTVNIFNSKVSKTAFRELVIESLDSWLTEFPDYAFGDSNVFEQNTSINPNLIPHA